MTTTLVRDVRPWGGPTTDLLVVDGVIALGGDRDGGAAAAPDVVVEGAGRLALPAFTDAHVHLDSTRVGLPFRPHSSQGRRLWDLIENDRRHWRQAETGVAERATTTLGRAIAHGMTRARSYAQVDADCRLERLDGVLAAREHHHERAQVQVVAFPQAGILLEPGVPDLLDAALRAGADVIGGIDPCGLDRDPVRHLDVVFELAERHDVPIDVHLHEPGELGRFSLDLVLERVEAHGLRSRVTVAHAFVLADLAPEVTLATAARLAEWDVAVTTVAPGGRGALPLALLLEHGVRVGLGQDGQRDYWSPYGTTDMLDRAHQLAFTQDLRQDDLIERCVEVASLGGAAVIDPAGPWRDTAGRGLGPGCAADIVLVPGETVTSAVMDRPQGRTVLRAGRVVAEAGALL